MSPEMDLGTVRRALGAELSARGYSVARDTLALRNELYIWGEGDRAGALFEFKANAAEACSTMYQGSWLPTLPPRFAVLPVSEKDSPAVDVLQQAGLSVLLYEVADGCVAFIDLEPALAMIAGRSGRPDWS